MKPPPRRILRKPGKDEIDPQAAQDAHEDLVGSVTELLTLGVCHNGVLREAEAFAAATSRRLFHGLGRVPKFVLPVMTTGTNHATLRVLSDAEPRQFVTLEASATTVVNVLIA